MKYVCERLNQDHIIEWFDCGYGNSLGQWLIDHGRQFQDRFQSQIWVMCPQGTSEVVGYFSLSSHVLEPNLLRRKIRDGIPPSVSHPAQLLGKFAIDTSVQGTGASDNLMFHVFRVYASIAELSGTRFLVLEAPNEKVREVYQRFGFKSLSDEKFMVISTAAVRKAVMDI